MKKLFLILAFGYSQLYAQQDVTTSAQTKEVTVFTSGAEITNTVLANLPKGNVKLLVRNIANDIDVRSIQLGGAEHVTVLSITPERVSNQSIVNANHQKLKDSIDLLTDDRLLLINKKTAAEGALRILNNEKILSGEGRVDLNSLSALVSYYQEKSVTLNTDISKLTKQLVAIDKSLAILNTKIREFIGGGTQIAIQLLSGRAGNVNLALTYRTNSASWQPYYDLRATSISSPLSFSYKARINQYTGVDWKNVKLILSTGNPSVSGDAPLLQPNYITFDAPYRIAQQNAMLQNTVQSLGTRAKMADMIVEEVSSEPVAGPKTVVLENQLNASFEIDVPYDILSNGQPHSVNLQSFNHPALFKYYAVPKIDKDAFLLAEISDYQSLSLMPGEANVFFENMFVGKSFLNPSVTTDTLNLSMGRDKSINIKRERILDQRSTQVSGGTKRQTYTYEIRVRNNKSTAINMLLKDQYPVSTDKDIVVTLQENGGASVNNETGVLTWMITVNPGETKTYRFQYQVRHPRDREIYF